MIEYTHTFDISEDEIHPGPARKLRASLRSTSTQFGSVGTGALAASESAFGLAGGLWAQKHTNKRMRHTNMEVEEGPMIRRLSST